MLDREQLRELVDSPLYLGGVHDRDSVALVNPARLAWGLRDACLSLGVRIHEGTRATDFGASSAAAVEIVTESDAGPGIIRADRVALATNAFPPLLRRLSHYVVPVYDYVIVTEPLSTEQWDAIGWADRQGIGDMGNQFHYYRPTDDGRILFGGYDAIHQSRMSHKHDSRPESFALLAEHLTEVFPLLDGIRATHAWGGAIDTCSRFSAFFGTAKDDRVAYAAGYTGLGVGATRFGAAVMLDLLDGKDTERTRTEMVRTHAGAVPAGAGALRGDRAHDLVARPRRPLARPPQRVAPHARPPRPRLRQLTVAGASPSVGTGRSAGIDESLLARGDMA